MENIADWLFIYRIVLSLSSAALLRTLLRLRLHMTVVCSCSTIPKTSRARALAILSRSSLTDGSGKMKGMRWPQSGLAPGTRIESSWYTCRMGFGLFLRSLIAREASARAVLGSVSNVEESSMVTRDTGRGGLELRGDYRGRPTMVRICLVWTGCWIKMKTPEVCHKGFNLTRGSGDMDRDAYAVWHREQDPTWDASAAQGGRRYPGRWAYLDASVDEYGEAGKATDYDQFMTLPEDLRASLIAAVDQDRYGSARLMRDALKLSIAERIFRIGDPVALIEERLDLAARVLDCES